MDRELEILVDAVSRGVIKNDRASLKIIHDALISNIEEGKRIHATLMAAHEKGLETFKQMQILLADNERMLDELIGIIALNMNNLRDIKDRMKEYDEGTD